MTFYDNRKLQSHNAVLNMTDGARNTGKTWSHKIRSAIRNIEHGTKTVWLRYFRKDVKETMKKAFYSKKLIDHINKIKGWKLTLENFRQDGNFVYFRKDKNSKWQWFISVYALSDEQAIKSADDPDVDTLVFEEYRITPEKLARYRGNPATDFLSIWVTTKRNNKVVAFLLGNKEEISDPIKNYFNIKPLDVNFQGIKTFKNGTIAVEQINDVPDEISSNFDVRFKEMLNGTSYGDFLYNGEIRAVDKSRIQKKPKHTKIYCSFDFGVPVSAFIDSQGYIYFAQGIDKSRMIATDKQSQKYKSVFVISSEDKTRFSTLAYAYKNNKVYYTDNVSYEQAFKIMRRLGIIKGV